MGCLRYSSAKILTSRVQTHSGLPGFLETTAAALLCQLLVVSAAWAQDARQSPAMSAVPIPSGVELQVDGRLDEAFWRNVPAMTDFLQKEPVEGAAPSVATSVRFAYDQQALYIGAVMSGDPNEIRAPVGRRDDAGQADYLIVSLDTYRDRRTAYSFGVTAGGTRLDRYHPNDSEDRFDTAFDPIWTARTARTADGWTAEMRIPFSQLRYNAGRVQSWGLNVFRRIPSREESIFWVAVPRDEVGWSSRFGLLTGLEAGRPSRGVELLPYVASGASFVAEPDPQDPFAEARESNIRVGGDAKVGIGSSLTLDATVNPDFGQVEADPAEVNLSAFETFFPERRPFFTEGSQLLNRSGLFYSRRIGGLPGRVPVGGDYADGPERATILGAAKLTGRLPSGTSVGILGALTDRESATTFQEDSGFGEAELAPRTVTGVATTVQEFGTNASTAGLQVAGVKRFMDGDSPLREYLHSSAMSARADWNIRFDQGAYELFGSAGFSHVRGDSTALLITQRASQRYYQRPDQDYVSVDPTRRSLSGVTGFLGFEKNSGDWLWNAVLTTESPGLELNDAGRLGDSDEYGAFATLTYRETTPGSWYRRYSVSLSSENLWTYDGTREFGALRSDASLTLPNFWRLDLTGWVDFRAFSTSLSRGGPLVGTGRSPTVIARLQNSSASDTRWNARIFYGGGEQGRRTMRLSGGLFIRPGPQWQLSVEPNYLRVTAPRQYVATLAGGPVETFGSRYVFSFIDRSTLFARLRASYAVRPDLTIEVYAEPFAASGEFHKFGELPEPGSRDLRFYGTDGTTITRAADGTRTVTDADDVFTISNRDFNVRSFRSNAVVRWEWRPGSTIFLVWQQNRFSRAADGALVGVPDLWDAVTTPGQHRILLKASYWLPLG